MATTVTAFYEIPSKFHSSQYWDWIANFSQVVKERLVIFTSPDLVDRFNILFPNAVIIQKRFEDLHHSKYYNDYEKSLDMDYQKGHSIELYIIWAEKVKFIMEAIKENPFNTEKFVWCDIGIFRQRQFFHLFKDFPKPSNIPDDKMTFLKLENFTMDNLIPDSYGIIGQNYMRNDVRIGGGIQGGNANAWKIYNDKWDAMLQRYFKAGRFAGQDQCIIGSIYLENTDLFNIVTPRSYGDGSDLWFYLLYHFSL
jgi:hypothetical protein